MLVNGFLVCGCGRTPFKLPDDIFFSNHIRDIEISEVEVFEALLSLYPNKAIVIDKIDMKYCAPVLIQPTHHLSLIYQPLLPDWKTHMISPVYESGKISAVNN